MHVESVRSVPVLVRDWRPMFPSGELRAVVLHWTAGDYETIYPAYHFCLSGATEVFVHATHELSANMRDVRAQRGQEYAAHVAGRNSYAAGIAICAMRGATPADFAEYPITGQQIDALCVVAAHLVRQYGIAIAGVRTHAEAALEDNYFGAGVDDQRWDIARLEPSPIPLVAGDAMRVGAHLRARIAALCA